MASEDMYHWGTSDPTLPRNGPSSEMTSYVRESEDDTRSNYEGGSCDGDDGEWYAEMAADHRIQAFIIGIIAGCAGLYYYYYHNQPPDRCDEKWSDRIMELKKSCIKIAEKGGNGAGMCDFIE